MLYHPRACHSHYLHDMFWNGVVQHAPIICPPRQQPPSVHNIPTGYHGHAHPILLPSRINLQPRRLCVDNCQEPRVVVRAKALLQAISPCIR